MTSNFTGSKLFVTMSEIIVPFTHIIHMFMVQLFSTRGVVAIIFHYWVYLFETTVFEVKIDI